MTRASSRISADRRAIWIGLLTVASVVLSGVFACATPFAGLAALAALDIDKRNGLVLIGLIWLANQFVGFAVLGYPHEAQAYAWGVAIGLGAVAGFLCAHWFVTSYQNGVVTTVVGSFAIAFSAYQLALYAATFVLPSSPGAFSFNVVFYVGLVNAIGFIVLLIAHWVAMAAGLIGPNVLEERTPLSA